MVDVWRTTSNSQHGVTDAPAAAAAHAAGMGADGGAAGAGGFVPYRLARMLTGHEGSVASVKFSPDGQWCVAARCAVLCCAAPTGAEAARRLASASADKTARVWRVSDGECVATLAGHAAGISDVAWSAGSDYLATASDDKTLGLWSVADGERLLSYRGHSAFVFCCAFNPQSNLLASGSFDETVRLWEARSGKCVAVLPAHSDPVTAVAFSHDGTLLVSGSYDGALRAGTGRAARARVHARAARGRARTGPVTRSHPRCAALRRPGADLEPAEWRVPEDDHPRRQPARLVRASASVCLVQHSACTRTHADAHLLPRSSRPTAGTCSSAR